MATIQYSILPDPPTDHIIPHGFWAGLVLFTCLWLIPVALLISFAHR